MMKSSELIEKKIASKVVYNGKIINVKLDTVELSDGSRAFREEIEHGGGACVLAVFEGKIALVSQFRYAYDKELKEIPAGKLEKGEDPMLAGARELKEETGLVASKLEKIAEMKPSPGYTNEIIYIYLAEDCRQDTQKLDKGELLNVEFIEIDKLFQMALDGEITDGKTLVAIYYYMNRLNKLSQKQ